MITLEHIKIFFSKTFGVVDVRYLRKWLIIAILIGIVAGVGSILFYMAISWATWLFLGQGAGYTPPAAGGEGVTVITPILRWWMIPVICTLGGLLSGFIVFKWAPEAEGYKDYLAFAHEMEKNDKVLIMAHNFPFALVTVCGDYKYRATALKGVWFRHFRKVKNIRYYADYQKNAKNWEQITMPDAIEHLRNSTTNSYELIEEWLDSD